MKQVTINTSSSIIPTSIRAQQYQVACSRTVELLYVYSSTAVPLCGHTTMIIYRKRLPRATPLSSDRGRRNNAIILPARSELLLLCTYRTQQRSTSTSSNESQTQQ